MFGDRQFSHVVQQGGRGNCFQLALIIYAEAFGEFECEYLNTSNVTMCDLILASTAIASASIVDR